MPPEKKEVNAFLEKVAKALPVPTTKIAPPGRSGGALIPASGRIPDTKLQTMTQGLRAAKLIIARILKDEGNLALLEAALTGEFLQDPSKFLRTYGPLLERYEDISPMEGERIPIRIVAACVNINRREGEERDEGQG